MKTIAASFNIQEFWLALTDEATEGTWLDFDGNPFGVGVGAGYVQEPGRYQNWNTNTGEPLAGQPNEDYVIMHLQSNWNGQWNDHYGTYSAPLICQQALPTNGSKLLHRKEMFRTDLQ